jgi:hypothetical protein
MAKKALCIGINDYPGTQSDLAGCINDAHDWSDLLDAKGFTVIQLLDTQATKNNMVAAIRGQIEASHAGDRVVITYSGHGTFVPDTSGDEPDGRDEGLCPYDIGQGQVLLDDEIHALFAARPAGVRVVLISDSCHSGSVIRWAPPVADLHTPRPRFLPPSVWLPEDQLPCSGRGEVMRSLPRGVPAPPWLGSLALPDGDLLMSGCQDHEYSYDANFGGRPNGAFTYYALKSLTDGMTYAEWYRNIRDYLPGASYPQTPQIFGSKQTKNSTVLT